jgi:hypothetical protein
MKAPIQIALATVILALLNESAEAAWNCDLTKNMWCGGEGVKNLCESCLAQGGDGYCYTA